MVEVDIVPPAEGVNMPEVTLEQRAEIIAGWHRKIPFAMRM